MKKTKHILLLLIVCLLSCCLGIFTIGCGDTAGNGGGNGSDDRTDADDEEYWIVGVEMTTPPNKADYGEGDVFDPTGMVLEVTWNDGWVQEVRNGQNCVFTPNGEITADTEQIKCTYDTYTFTVNVNVNKIDGIKLVSMPARTLYIEGETFSTVGMKICALFEDGETGSEITNYTLSENVSNLSSADTKVTVKYMRGLTEYSVDVPIKVVPANQVVTMEAENGTVTNGEKVKGSGSSLLQYASDRGFVKNLGLGATIVIEVKALKQTTASLRFVASSYEDDPENKGTVMPLQINKVFEVSFNDTKLAIGDDEILPGGVDDERGTNSKYCHWYEIVLDGVTLNAGSNRFVITSLVNMKQEDDLHSVLFDCLRVFYADADAIPTVDSESPTANAGGVYQAEDCELTGIARVVKAEGASSGLFSYMEAAGDTDPGFIKDFSAGGTLKLVFNSATAKKVKISIWGSSTSNASINLSMVISDMKLNDASVMPTDGVMFPAWGSITGAQAMANWQEYVVGEFDAVAGNNTFIITFNGTSNAFIDRIVISEASE